MSEGHTQHYKETEMTTLTAKLLEESRESEAELAEAFKAVERANRTIEKLQKKLADAKLSRDQAWDAMNAVVYKATVNRNAFRDSCIMDAQEEREANNGNSPS